VRFSSAIYNASEGSTSVGVTVIRDGPTGTTVTLEVKTTTGGTAAAGTCGNGADFTAITVPVAFSPGQTSRTVTIPLCPDTGVEDLETIGLVLDNVAGATSGTPSAATVRIAENDVAGSAQLAADASSVSEAQGTANVLVTRSGGNASGLKVHWTITGGTALHGGAPGPGVDYTGSTSGVVVFDLNGVSRSIPIPVWPRAGAQGPRSVTLVLDWADGGGSLGARTTTTLWILDADIPDPD
jgi:Calx-beta domain-containing protein